MTLRMKAGLPQSAVLLHAREAPPAVWGPFVCGWMCVFHEERVGCECK